MPESGINQVVENDNTKPFARMGRKAYRVSLRQPGCRNVTLSSVPGFSVSGHGKAGEQPQGGDAINLDCIGERFTTVIAVTTDVFNKQQKNGGKTL
jgi:hypothetical protein